jgi:hypothetical protein
MRGSAGPLRQLRTWTIWSAETRFPGPKFSDVFGFHRLQLRKAGLRGRVELLVEAVAGDDLAGAIKMNYTGFQNGAAGSRSDMATKVATPAVRGNIAT